MPEEVLKSGSSEVRVNPRLRNTRRVRAVPYESCGGLCSFLNSGCFAMCCGGRPGRRKSIVQAHKTREDKQVEPEKDEVSDTPLKILIKPNTGDGVTDADLEELEKSEAEKFYENDDNSDADFIISKAEIELESSSARETIDEDKDSAFSLNEDTLSTITETSAQASEAGKKKKKGKKFINILSFVKRKKSTDVATTSEEQATKIDEPGSTGANSEIPEGNSWEIIETQNSIFEKCLTQSKQPEIPVTPTEDPKEEETILNVSSEETEDIQQIENKQEKSTKELEDTKSVPVDESDAIKIIKLAPLGTAVPPPKNEDTINFENMVEAEIEPNIEQTIKAALEKPKKKFLWRSSVKKVKRKSSNEAISEEPKEVSKSDSEKNTSSKKSFLGRWGSLKRAPKVSNTDKNRDSIEKEAPDETELSTQTNENVEETSPELAEDQKIERERLSKHEKSNQQKFVPPFCGSCTVSKQASGKNGSDDAAEVKTIASFDEELRGKKARPPIRIIRNDFFPADICNKVNRRYSSDGSTEGGDIGEIEKENVGSDDGVSGQSEGGSLREEVEARCRETMYSKQEADNENTRIAKENIIVNPGADYIIIASADSICTHEISLKDDDVDGKSIQIEEKAEEYSLPDGVFRTMCSLSIEGSTEVIQDNQVNLAESVSASTDTLIGTKTDVTDIEDSTETLTEDKESSEWIEVNAEGLNDAKFNYIYKSTLKHVQNEVDNLNSETEKKNEAVEVDQVKCSCVQIAEDLNKNEAGDFIVAQKTICVCGTLTRGRPSVIQLIEGNVQSKIQAFNQLERPIILPIALCEKDPKDDITISEAHSSPTLGSKSGTKSATPSPIAAKSRSGTLSSTNSEWQHAEEDIDRLMVLQGRSSLSSLGLRSDSMASVYSGAGEGRYGTVTVRGQVEFGLQYNYKAGALEIHVKQCKDLAPVDIKRNRSDPYVKVYLLPDKSKGGKRKTKVKKHTLNPVFDETLKFHISLNGLETRTLWLTVWHSDMFGRNDFLGEVMMALENKVFDDPTPKLYNLQERTEPFDDTISFKGDIIVCLKFLPPDMTVQKKGKRSRGTLHVLVKEAKYLTAYKANGTSDPFCKSYLLPDKGRNSKQKTPVIKKTVNPVWNHTFIYDDVTLQELAERCLELTVWDHDRLASNEFLGGVRFSLGTGKHYGKPVEWMDASGKEMTLWKSMLERPNFWVEGCLSLRSTLEARTS